MWQRNGHAAKVADLALNCTLDGARDGGEGQIRPALQVNELFSGSAVYLEMLAGTT